MECLFAQRSLLVYDLRMTFLNHKLFLAAFLGLLVFVNGAALAQESKDPFKGVEMDEIEGTFIVTKSAVNLRAAPSTKGSKISKLLKGEQVKVIGKAKGGSWFAIVRENGEKGFSYGPVFLRVISGALEAPIKGNVKVQGGPECSYDLKYEKDESEAEEKDQLLVADYWVDMNCRIEGKNLAISGFMFMTEMPWNQKPGGSHQISLELANIAVSYDRVISAVTMWRIDKKTLVFDSVTPKKFKASKPIKEREVSDVPTALKTAIEIGLSAWNKDLWKTVVTKGTAAMAPAPKEDDAGGDAKPANEKKENDEEQPKKPLPGMEHSGRGDE